MERTRVVVTGGTGMLGRTLVALLRSRGTEVTLVGRKPPVGDWADGANWVHGDVERERFGLDPAAWKILARGVQAVFHLAARTDFVGTEWEEYRRTNIAGARHAAELAAEGDASLHHVSTAFVCGDRRGRFAEADLDVGQGFRNLYERSKFEAERALRGEWAPKLGVRWTVHRPGIILESRPDAASGHRIGPLLYVDALARLASASLRRGGREKPLRVEGSADAALPLVYDHDVALALVALADKPEAAGRVFHLVPDPPVPNRLLERSVNEAFGRPVVRWSAAEEWASEPPSPEERLLQRTGAIYAPYQELDVAFDRRNLDEVLGASALPAPEADDLQETFLTFLQERARLDKQKPAKGTRRWSVPDPSGAGGCTAAASPQPTATTTDPAIGDDGAATQKPPAQPADSATRSVRQYFGEFLVDFLGRALVPQLVSLNEEFWIEVAGAGTWSLVVRVGALESVTVGRRSGGFGYRVEPEAFLDVVAGRRSPQETFFSGQTELHGDRATALRTATALEEFFRRRPWDGREPGPFLASVAAPGNGIAPPIVAAPAIGIAPKNGTASVGMPARPKGWIAFDEVPRRPWGEVVGLARKHMNPGLVDLLELGEFTAIDAQYAEGACIHDQTGRRIVDFVSSYGALNLGHNHPRVRAALERVLADRRVDLSKECLSRYTAVLAHDLAVLAPGDLESVYFCNSGAESVEAALKLAQRYHGGARRRFVYAQGSMHGKTLGALSVTGGEHYRDVFRLPEQVPVPYGDLEAVERALRAAPAKGDLAIAGVIVEPVQGEAGVIVPPDGYLRGLRELCDRHGALLILDEVQTGFGRTGRMFGCQWDGVVPDIMAVAKTLGGGMASLAATISRGEVSRRAYGNPHDCLIQTTTFGGRTSACAAGIAALETVIDERLPERAERLGALLRERLREIQARHPEWISEVRGRGLMLGIEFHPELVERVGSKALWIPGVKAAVRRHVPGMVAAALLKNHGFLCSLMLNHRSVLRVYPPLGIDEADLERFAVALEQVLGEGFDALVKGRLRHALKDGFEVALDSARPTLFARAETETVHGRELAQLVYVFWYPRRPVGAVQKGEVDGGVLRVTLDAAGRTAVFEYADVRLPARGVRRRIGGGMGGGGVREARGRQAAVHRADGAGPQGMGGARRGPGRARVGAPRGVRLGGEPRVQGDPDRGAGRAAALLRAGVVRPALVFRPGAAAGGGPAGRDGSDVRPGRAGVGRAAGAGGGAVRRPRPPGLAAPAGSDEDPVGRSRLERSRAVGDVPAPAAEDGGVRGGRGAAHGGGRGGGAGRGGGGGARGARAGWEWVEAKLHEPAGERVGNRYRVSVTPTLIVLDAQGREVRRVEGISSAAEFIAALTPTPNPKSQRRQPGMGSASPLPRSRKWRIMSPEAKPK